MEPGPPTTHDDPDDQGSPDGAGLWAHDVPRCSVISSLSAVSRTLLANRSSSRCCVDTWSSRDRDRARARAREPRRMRLSLARFANGAKATHRAARRTPLTVPSDWTGRRRSRASAFAPYSDGLARLVRSHAAPRGRVTSLTSTPTRFAETSSPTTKRHSSSGVAALGDDMDG